MSSLNQNEVNDLRKVLQDFKPITGYFEKDILLPEIKGRLEYIIEVFKSFKEIANDDRVAIHVDEAIRRVADEGKINIKSGEPHVGKQYLSQISELIDSEYLGPIQSLIDSKYQNIDELSKNLTEMTNVLNDTIMCIQSISAVKDVIFKYSMRDFPSIKDTKTGEVILGEPAEVTLALMPFETRIQELVNIVDTTIGSIKKWSGDLRDQRVKNTELLVKMAEIKSIKENQRLQVYIITVSIVFIILGFIFGVAGNNYIEKKQLENGIEQILIENDKLDDDLKKQKSKLSSKEAELDSAKKNLDLIKSETEKKLEEQTLKLKKVIDAKNDEIRRLRQKAQKK